MIDPDLAAEWAVDNALDTTNDPSAGDYPPDDYLAEEADRRYRDHCDQVHGGQGCTCVTTDVPYSASSPF